VRGELEAYLGKAQGPHSPPKHCGAPGGGLGMSSHTGGEGGVQICAVRGEGGGWGEGGAGVVEGEGGGRGRGRGVWVVPFGVRREDGGGRGVLE